MYENDTYLILAGILSLILIITFFIMANRLKRILDILELFKDTYIKTNEIASFYIKCTKCGKEFKAPKGKSLVNCPECQTVNLVKATS
jgi:LSD1 subclass zinc finger protein